MTEQWIAATQIFDGAALHSDAAICVEYGKVSAIAPRRDTVRAKHSISGVLCPGFLDLQVNGGGGVLLNSDPTIEGIKQIISAHRQLGTSHLLPTVITDHPDVLPKVVDAALDAKDLPGFAGLHIEGPHIDPRKRGTHAEGFIRPLDSATFDQIGRLRQQGITVMITLAPEAAQPGQIAQLAQTGVIVSLGHSACRAVDAHAGFDAGATVVTHLFNAMSQMEGREPGLVGAALISDAYAGMICDGQHVHDQMLALAIRARGTPERFFLVSDAMPSVGGPDKFELYGQTIRLRDGKLINAEGNLAGAHSWMAAGVARLIGQVGVEVPQALAMASSVPASAIGRPDLGGLIGRSTQEVILLNADGTFAGNLNDVIEKQMA